MDKASSVNETGDRGAGCSGQLQFEPITDKNREEAEALEILPEQYGFIESVRECLRESDELELWRPVGIYDGDAMIGFAMYGYFPAPFPGRLWMDRLLIDKRCQGMGYGKRAVAALLDRLQEEYGSDTVYLSVYKENAAAIRLYRQAGFCFNGELDVNGEHVMVWHAAGRGHTPSRPAAV